MKTIPSSLFGLRQALMALIVPAVVLAGCSSSTPEPTPAPETSASQSDESTLITDEVESSQSATEDGITVIEVEGGSFYYKPNEIRVKKGETVKIVLKSVDMMHDFVIDELDVKMPITKSGETNEVTFTADTVGEFEYYCSVGQHRAQGQVGTLIVEE